MTIDLKYNLVYVFSLHDFLETKFLSQNSGDAGTLNASASFVSRGLGQENFLEVAWASCSAGKCSFHPSLDIRWMMIIMVIISDNEYSRLFTIYCRRIIFCRIMKKQILLVN
jgi:hypothetical protein